MSILGIGSIISNGDIQKIISLSFNKGDIWMLVCVITWSLYSTLLKNINLNFHSLLYTANGLGRNTFFNTSIFLSKSILV